jgi:Tol biopolymer transport system component/DNA-binding winged helix-turn-helix (wHTH) protein
MAHRENGHSFRFDEFTVDTARRLLLRNNRPIPLGPKAFDLLLVLLENRGKVMTKEGLLERVWPNQFVEEGNLSVHISALRKALGERKGEPRYLTTIPGSGYRFVPDPAHAIEAGEAKDRTLIEQHMLSRVIEERYEGETGNITERLKGVASKAGSQSGPASDPPALQGLLVAPSPEPHQKTVRPLLARRRWLRTRVFALTGGILSLTIGSIVIHQFYNNEQNGRGTAGKPSGSHRMTIRQLTAFGHAGGSALSPDGRYFVYEAFKTGKDTLWFGNVNGGNPVQLGSSEDAFYGAFRFARDGRSILYQLNGALFQIPTLGGAPQKLLDRVSINFGLSTDGQRVAFVRGDIDRKVSAIIIANLDGTGERELVTLPAGAGFSRYGPAWSPDGRMLAIGAASQTNPNQQVLISVQVADGEMQLLNPQAWDEICTVAWTSDGKAIVFHGRGPESDYHLWLLDYPQGGLRCITPDPSRYGRSWGGMSDDGNSLVATRGQDTFSVWVGPAEDIKQSRQTTNGSLGKEDGCWGLAWTPDGKIVYASAFNNSYTLWVMNQDGSDATQITPAGFVDTLPRVTADGRYIVFQSNRGGSSEIWRVNPDGSDMRRLTSGGSNASPELTPDGKWVFYVSTVDGSGTIWKVSIDGGEPSRVIDRPSDWPALSPDGRLLACAYFDRTVSSHTQLAVISLDDLKLLYHFNLARFGTFNNGLHWSPDGSAVVYRNFPGGLWRQPLTGGTPERLPGAPDKRIYYFDWSRDGKQFAMAYGDEIGDAVLISNFR